MFPFSFTSRTPINKGWSSDQKYRVTDGDGTPYLLRISAPNEYESCRAGFEMMQRVSDLSIPMCRPVAFGTCDDGVYSLQSWIDGDDLRDIAHTLTDTQLREYGRQAGQILRKIHSITAPESVEDWGVRYGRKLDRKLKMYAECSLKYENGDAFVDCIHENRHLIVDRPQTFHHGDYHTGNMMIGHDGNLYIIDFNRHDFGDPWEEFNRIPWCVNDASPAFASEFVDGYFDGDVPIMFWRLLMLYISSNMLSSLPWAIPFGDGEIATMRSQARDILEWFDGMRNPVPTWYRNRE